MILYPFPKRMMTKYMLQSIKLLTFKFGNNYGIERAIIESPKGSPNNPFENINKLLEFLNRIFARKPLEINIKLDTELMDPESFINVKNQEKFNVLSHGNNSIVYFGNEFFDYVFRGQTKDFGKCIPSLFRNIEKITYANRAKLICKFIDLCKTIEFENAINLHPFVKTMKGINNNHKKIYYIRSLVPGLGTIYHPHTEFMLNYLNKYPIRINYTALAQHYGYATNLLDATTSFEVAAFFAIADFDETTNSYIQTDEKECGVIYIIPWYHLDVQKTEDEDVFDIVGWQPLKRTEVQQACVFNMTYGDDLNHITDLKKLSYLNNFNPICKFYFIHDKDAESTIFKRFMNRDIMSIDSNTKVFVDIINESREIELSTAKYAHERLLKNFKLKKEEWFTFEDLVSNFHNLLSNLPDCEENKKYKEHKIVKRKAPLPEHRIMSFDYHKEYISLLEKLHYRRGQIVHDGYMVDSYLQGIDSRTACDSKNMVIIGNYYLRYR